MRQHPTSVQQYTQTGTIELPQLPDTAPPVTFVTTLNWYANRISFHGEAHNGDPHPTLVGATMAIE